jgi:hypothetical protein
MSDQVPRHDELPLPDYDHLPTGSLASRIRSLSTDQVAALLDYERAHGKRLPAVQVLEARIEQLGAGSPTSDGDPVAPAPESSTGEPGGSKVSPATEGPPMNPPSHGDPTNPAQPRG